MKQPNDKLNGKQLQQPITKKMTLQASQTLLSPKVVGQAQQVRMMAPQKMKKMTSFFIRRRISPF